MSWTTLIWNMFTWLFTGVMIYITGSSLWWLLLPAVFTATNDAAELLRATKEEVKEETAVDEETTLKMIALRDKAKRSSL